MTRYYAGLPQMNMPFAGAKLAILLSGRVLVIQLDARADIPYPGYWDLPGGGRERGKTPVQCALRETREELGLRLAPARLRWGRFYGENAARTWFFFAHGGLGELGSARLGEEGQRWRAMPNGLFLRHPLAIPHFRSRLAEYPALHRLKEKPPAASSGGR